MKFFLYCIAVCLTLFIHPLFGIAVAILLLLAANDNIPLLTPKINNDPRFVEFMSRKNVYLRSPEWKQKRQQVLFRDRHMCRNCNVSTNLQVHHVSYRNLCNEPLHDLITLCDTCHTKLHEHYGYPQTYDEYINSSFLLPKDL